MFNIRQGAFETNSSSMHTIIINNPKDGYKQHDPITGWIRRAPLGGKLIEYEDLDFQFGQGYMTHWADKLGYLFAYHMQYDTYDEEAGKILIERYLNMVQKHYPEINEIRIPHYVEKDDDGDEHWEWNVSINHQSQDLIEKFFEDNPEVDEEEFVFSDKYAMYICWDSVGYSTIIETCEEDNREVTGLEMEWGITKVKDGKAEDEY